MADTPSAMQLRLLQTVVDVAAEKNSTLVMPFPVELLRFFEKATTAAGITGEVPAAVPGPANGHRNAPAPDNDALAAPNPHTP